MEQRSRFRHHGRRSTSSPSLRGLWSPPSSYISPSHSPPFPPSSVSPTPPSAMSNDDSRPRHLEPTTMTFSAPHTLASNSTVGNDDGNGPFDPGNTPPLIFAFIALGFTLFGLVIAYIYKRCRQPRNSPDPRHQRSVPTRPCSAQKPKLWDVWIPAEQHASDEDRTRNSNDWDNFKVSSVFCPPSVRCRRRSVG
jgi:hypothetical protein